MFKFGRSTRMYIVGGPDELRPEQGLTKDQRRTAAALEVLQSAIHLSKIPEASTCVQNGTFTYFEIDFSTNDFAGPTDMMWISTA